MSGRREDIYSRSPGHFAAHRLQADVVNPHLANFCFTHDLKLKSQGRGFGLGLNKTIDLRPAADGLQALLEAAAVKRAKGYGRFLELRYPDVAFPLGAGGNQVPEPQSHLSVIANR